MGVKLPSFMEFGGLEVKFSGSPLETAKQCEHVARSFRNPSFSALCSLSLPFTLFLLLFPMGILASA